MDAQAQRKEALDKANHIRMTRARIKRELFSGDLSLRDALFAGPPEAEGLDVLTLLTSLKRFGMSRSRKVMLEAGIHGNPCVGRLTERQRMALVESHAARTR